MDITLFGNYHHSHNIKFAGEQWTSLLKLSSQSRAGEWISLLLEIIITVTILKCLGPIDYKCGKGSEVQKLLPVFFFTRNINPL